MARFWLSTDTLNMYPFHIGHITAIFSYVCKPLAISTQLNILMII
ncbi:hypothetical protein DSUL_140063 [Desulfovibrionales bacterium]